MSKKTEKEYRIMFCLAVAESNYKAAMDVAENTFQTFEKAFIQAKEDYDSARANYNTATRAANRELDIAREKLGLR